MDASRNDLARQREGFRTVERETLSTRDCPVCKGRQYVVPVGTWLHWSTLGEACLGKDGPKAVSKPRQGAKLAAMDLDNLDTPERGLARAMVGGSYARPSWEWMACR